MTAKVYWLAGPPCVGKSQFGRPLARSLGFKYLDVASLLPYLWRKLRHPNDVLANSDAQAQSYSDAKRVVFADLESHLKFARRMNHVACPTVQRMLLASRTAGTIVECSVGLLEFLHPSSGHFIHVTRAPGEHLKNIVKRHHVSIVEAIDLRTYYLELDHRMRAFNVVFDKEIDATEIARHVTRLSLADA